MVSKFPRIVGITQNETLLYTHTRPLAFSTISYIREKRVNGEDMLISAGRKIKGGEANEAR